MNEIIKLLLTDFAHFYIGLAVFLVAWGALYFMVEALNKLINKAYRKFKAYQKRKEVCSNTQNIDN